MNKKILVILCSVMLLSASEAMAQDNVIDRVEWVVGDKSILRSDIEEAIRYWAGMGKRFDGDRTVLRGFAICCRNVVQQFCGIFIISICTSGEIVIKLLIEINHIVDDSILF